MPYAELHCISNFTFLRGASHPEELIARAQELGYVALAITDECSLAGIVRAHVEAKKCSLPLIIGSDNMGQAIAQNGLGAIPENYNNFLGKTRALYGGAISPQIYRDSLTSFVGGGTYNQRSFDCIVARLPATAK